jgi:ammonium transporter, Amt family
MESWVDSWVSPPAAIACQPGCQSCRCGSWLLIVGGVILLDKLQIDDPVGAFPVHGLCGVWGCLAIGLLPNTHLAAGNTTLMTQLIGTASICGWSFVTMAVLFGILKLLGLLRVSPEEEQTGLDISEHGMHAYPVEGLNRAG